VDLICQCTGLESKRVSRKSQTSHHIFTGVVITTSITVITTGSIISTVTLPPLTLQE